MAKKRTSLDSLFEKPEVEGREKTASAAAVPRSKKQTPITSAERSNLPGDIKKDGTSQPSFSAEPEPQRLEKTVSKSEIVKQTVYLPAGVYEQLRHLAFEERRKMHDYLVEGLDRVFQDRGLKSFDQLKNSQK